VWFLFAAVVVVGAATVCVFATGMRPGYDAYGWIVWGHQTFHWNLNTDGAPSWKPLPYLFTLPYTLAGRGAMWLWMITAVAGAFFSAVFGARIAWRMTGPAPGRPYAPVVAALFAGLGVLGLDGYAHQVMIANSDPLIVALCLAAIDAHLSGRPRLAFALVWLAALGRPEVWPFVFLYAVWTWRSVPPMRLVTALGLLLIPVLWFVIPGLTSKSWFRPGDLALNAPTVIHGNKFTGVFNRWRELYDLPMQIAAVVAVGYGLIRRDRTTLILTSLACLWVAVEIAFALHGWSATQRYVFEPATVMVVVIGGAIGHALAYTPRRRLLMLLAPVAVVALLVLLVPTARNRVRIAKDEVETAQVNARAINRLNDVINRLGGGARILACGQPVSLVGFQSTLAWYVGLNVGNVGYKPGLAINGHLPIVFFKPHDYGWQIRPDHLLPSTVASCSSLRTDTADG
jgi:hypothetical protein